ncbi:MAG: ATP-binding cassette domain-containing protein [Deltaproteobacteria bacterium]|nr:ATP-binding cassette domain-containing protein [Deltaproteobacteria bacterium]
MTADDAPIIAVENLTARFGDVTIFQGVSFQVRRGEILVILGGSGCGKSTLLKHMIGLYHPAAGRVLIHGVDVNTKKEKELNRLRMDVGVSFQGGALFGSMTVAENIALPLRVYTDLSKADIDLIVKMKLALVNLTGFDNHLPEELSGGMVKRVALARALALDPTVLFFDEPSAGLDPVTAAELDLLILGLNAGMGTTMVVVTHELQSIFKIAHRVVMLDKSAKGLIAMGRPQELKEHSTDPRVLAFFNRQPVSIAQKGT